MNIFSNGKSKLISKENISLEEYDRKIDERKLEFDRLNDILRGMRSEVANLMSQIKQFSDELNSQNNEKLAIEKNIEDLTRNYHLLLQNVEEQQDTLLSLRNNLAVIKDEIRSNLSLKEKLDSIKTEYNFVSEQVSVKKTELQNLIEEGQQVKVIQAEKNEKSLSNTGITQKQKKCSAKTKSGFRCKRFALRGSEFCSFHSKQIKGL